MVLRESRPRQNPSALASHFPTPCACERFIEQPMAKSSNNEYGVKELRSKKSNKAHRNFELHGAYSQKHIRANAARMEEQSLRGPETDTQAKKAKRGGNR